jgi:hypothetical protein
MRIQVFLPCLIIVALCGLLLSQKRPSRDAAGGSPPAATARPTGAGGARKEILVQPKPVERADTCPVRAPVAGVETGLPASPTVDEIATALANPEAETRADACAAAVQSGNRGMIPVLQSAAERAADAREKAALLEAADFLALPTMSEVLAEQ